MFPFRVSSETITYTYGTSGRVTEAALNYGVHILYSYDVTGNRLQRNIAIDTPGAGDVNNDGSVTLEDALLSLQILSGNVTDTPVFKDSDINSNDRIDLVETVWIMQIIAE